MIDYIVARDIVARLRECDEWHKGTNADCPEWLEAADEIERLRAERDACIREVAEAGKRQGQAEAELAAANARMSDLDFERTAARLMFHKVEAERDALRELLREARGHVGHQWDLARRIDAALGESSEKTKDH